MDDDKANNKFKKKKDGIEIEVKDPIYDVMSESEIDTASERFASLLEEDEDPKLYT